MPFLKRDNCRIHWEQDGTGTPVLLIMGAVYSSRLWYPLLPALTQHHQAIWFDNRGTGQSTASRVASISDMARDALAVLDAAEVETAHVYGISLGGVVAQQFAIEAPERVRSLVLGCTCILTPDKPRAPKSVNRYFRLPRRVRVSRTTYGPVCPPERAARNQEVLRGDAAKARALIAQQNALRAYAASYDAVASLQMPALVLHGTDDPIVPVAWGRELAEALPDSRLVVYPGSGHNYLVEMGEQANDDVLAFLAEVDAATIVGT